MDRRSRILLTVTALSLATNVFVLGLWLGGAWHGDNAESGTTRRFIVDFTIPEEALPPDLRAPFLAKLHHENSAFARDLAELRAAQEAVQAALTAEPFDRQRLDAAYARLRRAQEQLQAKIQRNLATAVAGLDRERRRMLAQRLRALGERQRALMERRRALQERRRILHQAGAEEAFDDRLLAVLSPRYERLNTEFAHLQAEFTRLQAELRALEERAPLEEHPSPAPDRPQPPH